MPTFSEPGVMGNRRYKFDLDAIASGDGYFFSALVITTTPDTGSVRLEPSSLRATKNDLYLGQGSLTLLTEAALNSILIKQEVQEEPTVVKEEPIKPIRSSYEERKVSFVILFSYFGFAGCCIIVWVLYKALKPMIKGAKMVPQAVQARP